MDSGMNMTPPRPLNGSHSPWKGLIINKETPFPLCGTPPERGFEDLKQTPFPLCGTPPERGRKLNMLLEFSKKQEFFPLFGGN
jgi:hypothetical protein